MIEHIENLKPGVINLDEIDRDDLHEFIQATRGSNPALAAQRMFGGESFAIRTVRCLNQYARHKEIAMACRKRGDIQSAINHEDLCDGYYDDLPVYAKW